MADISFQKSVFCERVELNPDESPRAFINQFTSLQSDVYPYLLPSFVININFTHSKAIHNQTLGIAIRLKRDGHTVFHSALVGLNFAKPFQPRSVGVNLTLRDVMFPEPGPYSVEILLNDRVQHRDQLLVESALYQPGEMTPPPNISSP